MQVKGTIKYQALGMGAWTLIADNGKTYELSDPPSGLKQDNLSVIIQGKIRNDIMTIAMVGDILQVISFEIL